MVDRSSDGPRNPIADAIDGAEIISDGSGAEVVSFPRAHKAANSAKPPRLPEGGSARSMLPGAGASPVSLDLDLAFLPMTDLGNAERFARRFADRLIHCPALGWLSWDGRRWAREGAEARVKQAEHETVRAIQDEAQALRQSGRDAVVETLARGKEVMLSEKLARHGRSSEAKNKMAAISDRAACMMAVAANDLDADPMRFNVLNGTLVLALRDGEDPVQLREHRPRDLMTKLAPVEFDRDATCPLFDKFMNEVQPDPQVQRFLDQWAGLSLTGDMGEQKLTFHYGKGRNGKGVWANTIKHIAGDYADTIQIESFLDAGRARAGGQATPDLAALPGVRFLTTSEPEKGAKLAEGLVKMFTGGDYLKARHLNMPFFSFLPQAKLTMQGNYRPRITGTDEGIWNRLLLVPWGIYIPPELRDRQLARKLQGEASGILNRFLDGFRDWLDRGLCVPDAVAAATAGYRADSDPLGRFLETCTRPALGSRVQSSELHKLFCAWAKANGERDWSPNGFGRAMRERGIPDRKADVVWWLDLEMTKHMVDFMPSSRAEDDDANDDSGRYRD